MVVCQHSHYVGSFEEYDGSNIIYGQGNFIFDHSESEFWRTSLIVKVNIDDGLGVEYILIVKKDNMVRLVTG